MTLREARKRAAERTAAGVPTMVVKRYDRDGYQTKNVVVRRANDLAYRNTDKGRARQFRHDAHRRNGRRLNVTAADITRLRAEQGHICPITGKPLNTINTANDHAHDDVASGAGCLRGVIERTWNSVLGRTDKELFGYAENLSQYASKRRVVLIIRMCQSKPRKRKVSKRVVARVRAALRKTA